MNYENEFGKIQEGSGDTFKPKPGVHKLEILEEPTETVYIDPEGKETQQIKFKVKFKGDELSWYVSKGLTLKSVFGQLMALGKHKGQLKGEIITLSTASSKNKDGKEVNSYQIIEAIEILPELAKPKEEDVK